MSGCTGGHVPREYCHYWPIDYSGFSVAMVHCKHFRLIKVYRTCIDITRKH